MNIWIVQVKDTYNEKLSTQAEDTSFCILHKKNNKS